MISICILLHTFLVRNLLQQPTSTKVTPASLEEVTFIFRWESCMSHMVSLGFKYGVPVLEY
jgi:hypothetical protein